MWIPADESSIGLVLDSDRSWLPPLNQVYTVDYSSTNVQQHQNSSISKDLKGISVWCSFWCWKSLNHHLSDDLTPWQFIHPPSAVPAARRICVGHLEGLPSFPIINLRLSDECVDEAKCAEVVQVRWKRTKTTEPKCCELVNLWVIWPLIYHELSWYLHQVHVVKFVYKSNHMVIQNRCWDPPTAFGLDPQRAGCTQYRCCGSNNIWNSPKSKIQKPKPNYWNRLK